jgi:hypothetical protein
VWFVRVAFLALYSAISLLFVGCSVALLVLAGIRLAAGVDPTSDASALERLDAVLSGIAILTVATAALELGQTILEEEVQRESQMSAPTRVRRFLSRFMIVVVVALSIESLVLVFRFAHERPEHLPFAAAVAAATALLLSGWGLFVKLNRSAEELEPEAMQAAKREDKKVER